MKAKTYHYILICIKVIIIIMFIMVAIRGINQTYSQWDMSGAKYSQSLSFLEVGFIYSHFRPILIMLLPMVGLFLKRKIGWVLIMTYLYFVIARAIIFSINSIYNEDFTIIYIAFVVFIFIPMIVFFNLLKVSIGIYKIEKRLLFIFNILAISLGSIIAIFIFESF